jgi:CMP/dCMP kinase
VVDTHSTNSLKIIAIDGPAGSGKSTVARALSEILGLSVLDTGAMYRSVALVALESGTSLEDFKECARIANEIEINLDHGVRLGSRDIEKEIRGPEVTAAVSKVAAIPEVRVALVARQRQWVSDHGGGIVEGRDIGTVVFPNATLNALAAGKAMKLPPRDQLLLTRSHKRLLVATILIRLERFHH